MSNALKTSHEFLKQLHVALLSTFTECTCVYVFFVRLTDHICSKSQLFCYTSLLRRRTIIMCNEIAQEK